MFIIGFVDTSVSFSVVEPEEMKTEYPLAYSVGRASMAVPRHQPRIVRLEWKGDGEINETLMFSGKVSNILRYPLLN